MELSLDDDRSLLMDTTRRFLAETVPIPTVRALAEDHDGFDRGWWSRGAELGWTSMLAPERLGGGSVSGTPVSDLALIAFERGRAVAPGPFAAVNAALAALSLADPSTPERDELLAAAIGGGAVVVLAADEQGLAWPCRDPGTHAVSDGRSLVIDGVKVAVEAARQADAIAVLARSPGGGRVLIAVPIDARGVTVDPRRSVDITRRFGEVTLRGVAVPRSAMLTDDEAAIDHCLDIATVLQLAETVGALDRMLEMTRQWAFDRYTFGRPLASYQEIKHRFADMTLWLEASKATVVAAARAASTYAPEAPELVSAAASYVHDHGPELGQDCVQLHGGIGVTWEHDLHLYLRRVTLNALTFGTVRDHRERLAALVLDGASGEC